MGKTVLSLIHRACHRRGWQHRFLGHKSMIARSHTRSPKDSSTPDDVLAHTSHPAPISPTPPPHRKTSPSLGTFFKICLSPETYVPTWGTSNPNPIFFLGVSMDAISATCSLLYAFRTGTSKLSDYDHTNKSSGSEGVASRQRIWQEKPNNAPSCKRNFSLPKFWYQVLTFGSLPPR